jgi:hypothetical protein
MDTAFRFDLCGAGSIVISLVWLLVRRIARPRLPHAKRPSLLTAGELRSYCVLTQTSPPSMEVFVKVRLTDLVSVPDEE